MAGATSAAYLASRQFSQECYRASRALRRAPADVKKAVKAEIRADVAEPLARKIASAATGPYASALRPAVKTAADVVPRIKIGGARKVVSGGASVRQLVYGTEWGGGKRVANVNRAARSRGGRRRGRVSAAERAQQAAAGRTVYKRRTTEQFRTPHPFVFSTIRRERAAMLEGYADIVERALQEVLARG